jgi:hypothetical protein
MVCRAQYSANNRSRSARPRISAHPPQIIVVMQRQCAWRYSSPRPHPPPVPLATSSANSSASSHTSAVLPAARMPSLCVSINGRFHPSRVSGSSTRFKRFSAATEILDARLRRFTPPHNHSKIFLALNSRPRYVIGNCARLPRVAPRHSPALYFGVPHTETAPAFAPWLIPCMRCHLVQIQSPPAAGSHHAPCAYPLCAPPTTAARPRAYHASRVGLAS